MTKTTSTRMIAEVREGRAVRKVTGADVTDIARTQFGRDVTTRPEGHGIWAAVRDYGHGITGVVGRVHPVGRTA